MAKKKPADVAAPEGSTNKNREAADQQDVDGHMFINPTVARDLARYKSAEIEREARARRLAKEARPNKHGL
ncbi:MAG: hypothetical protein ACXWN5_08490 [Candidatus Limnocylindrales bacterium]